MRGNAAGKALVRASGQIKDPAARFFTAKKLEQGAVVWQVRYIERYGVGDECLESRLALEEPGGEFEDRRWPHPQHDQQGVDERI